MTVTLRAAAIVAMGCLALASLGRLSSRSRVINVRTTKTELSANGQPQASGIAKMSVPAELKQQSANSGELHSSDGCTITIAINGPSTKPMRGTLEPLMKKTHRQTLSLGRFLGVLRNEKLGDGRHNIGYELLGARYDITISAVVGSKKCEALLVKTVHAVASTISVN